MARRSNYKRSYMRSTRHKNRIGLYIDKLHSKIIVRKRLLKNPYTQSIYNNSDHRPSQIFSHFVRIEKPTLWAAG